MFMQALLFILVIYGTVGCVYKSYAENQNKKMNDITNSLQRLSGGLRIPTVGATDYNTVNFTPFETFKDYLKTSYPEIFRAMHVRQIQEHGLLLHWRGKNPAGKPLLFLSHYDVVPVDGDWKEAAATVFQPDESPYEPIQETQTGWDYPPYSGAVANGRVYGRGALDMKGMLFAILEAADRLIAEGFVPAQDIWFAFGHDEETGGRHGAVHMAQYLASQNIRFDAVFDEGGVIGVEGAVVPGIERPIAAIGLGEKGYLTLSIRVRGIGGHSSMPPEKSSLVLASELALLLNARQMPVRLIPPVEQFLATVENAGDGQQNTADAEKKRNYMKEAESNPALAPLTRTTTAITMMHGSDAPNVLAPVAELTVNFRILQGDTINDVVEHVREVCKDYDVEISVAGSAREASGLTNADSKGMDAIKRAVKEVYPDALVVPYITIGGTDAYKYQIVSDNIYRFMPIRLNEYELRTVHSENEHISIANYKNMIQYFYALMKIYEEIQP